MEFEDLQNKLEYNLDILENITNKYKYKHLYYEINKKEKEIIDDISKLIPELHIQFYKMRNKTFKLFIKIQELFVLLYRILSDIYDEHEIDFYEKVLDTEYEISKILIEDAKLYFEEENYTKSLKLCIKAINRNVVDNDVYQIMSNNYEKLGDIENSKKYKL
jgi:hypothetical protein